MTEVIMCAYVSVQMFHMHEYKIIIVIVVFFSAVSGLLICILISLICIRLEQKTADISSA